MTDNKQTHIEKLVIEVWNTGELHRSSEFYAKHFLFNGNAANANDALQYQARLRSSFNDLHFDIEDLFLSADGNKITLRWFAHARHKSDNRLVEWYGIHVFYFDEAGQISAVWSQNNPPA